MQREIRPKIRDQWRKLTGGPWSSKARKNWLSENFAAVKTASSNDNNVAVAQLPLLVRASLVSRSLRSPFFHHSSARNEFVLTPVAVVGSSEDDVIETLYDEVTDEDNDILLYLPKPGQTEAIIKFGEPYPCIHQDDPLHSHRRDTSHLIDFVYFDAHDGKHVEKTTLEGDHCHFLIG